MTDQQYTEAGSAIFMTATRRRGRKQTVLRPVEAISVHRMDVESPGRGFRAATQSSRLLARILEAKG